MVKMFVIQLKDTVLMVRMRDIVFTVVCILFSIESLITNVYYKIIPIQYRQVAFLIQSDMVWFMAMMLIACMREPIQNKVHYLISEDDSDEDREQG